MHIVISVTEVQSHLYNFMVDNLLLPSQQIGLLMTYRCNLNCKYCYIKYKQNIDMSYEQAITILQKYLNQEGGLLDITFYGGETLLVFKTIKKLIEWIAQHKWKRKYKFFGCTNGTLLNDENKVWLREHSDIFVLGLSYDGIPEIQFKNRGSQFIDIDFFIKTWPQQPIQMTINADSVGRMAEGVMFLSSKGAKVNPNVAYEEYEWSEDALKQYEEQLSILVKFFCNNPDLSLIGQFRYNLLKIASNINNPIPIGKSCGAGDGFLLYDVDGKSYPCHLLSPLVLNSSQLHQLPSISSVTNFSSNSCIGCPFAIACSSCIACNYLYRGDYVKRDATHCKITKIDIRASLRMAVNQLQKKHYLSNADAQLVDSINSIVSYLKK